MTRFDRYLKVVDWAKKRYSVDGYIETMRGGVPTVYSRIENIAAMRYLYTADKFHGWKPGQGSWAIVNRRTGKCEFETFNPAIPKKLNQSNYRAIPIIDYLGSLNA